MKGYIHITRRFEKAYVVFTDNTDLWWLRLLKPGFRHCYLLLSGQGGRCWLELNPCSDQIAVSLCEFGDSQPEEMLLRCYENCLIFPVKIKNAPRKCAPPGFFTCVEMVKRVLGIHDFRVITQYQLYKKLKVVGKNS